MIVIEIHMLKNDRASTQKKKKKMNDRAYEGVGVTELLMLPFTFKFNYN